MAMGKLADGTVIVDFPVAITISLITLAVTVFVTILGKGIFRLLPIMCGIVSGYTVALLFGVVSFDSVANAPWLAVPDFVAPVFNLEAIIYILPIAIAPAVEHIGDMLAISNVTKKDYLQKPGLKNTLLGDGLATSAASLFGGPPNTTY